MIKKNFDEVWMRLKPKIRYELVCYFRHPSERNSCYVTGYIAACNQFDALGTDNYNYLLALISRVFESGQVRKEVLEWTKGYT